MNNIYLFDTYKKKEVKFIPLKRGVIKMYHCGPTVYDYPHIGNMRAYVTADLLRRVFEFNGYKTKQVINITDVGHLTSDADSGEDKIEKKAKKEKKSAYEISMFFFGIFKKYIKLLNIKTPHSWTMATDFISEQISLIKKMEKKGFTYKTSDGIYFNTKKLKSYNKILSSYKNSIKPGKRIGINKEKQNPNDFALWKFSPLGKKRQMEWNSPWGVGFPGWHTECIAMIIKELGNEIDVHTGGEDHIFIHHPNEIAQSEAVNNKNISRYWVHTSFLKKGDKKISKSRGKLITLDDVIKKGLNPLSLRYLFLTSRYQSPLNFTWESLKAANNALNKLQQESSRLRSNLEKSYNKTALKIFIKKINNDLNMPEAIAFVWKFIHSNTSEDVKRSTLKEFDKVLGLDLFSAQINNIIPDKIIKLSQKRDKLRQEKKWKEADEIRISINKLGYDLKDKLNKTEIVKNLTYSD